jgi:hypothetical protein
MTIRGIDAAREVLRPSTVERDRAFALLVDALRWWARGKAIEEYKASSEAPWVTLKAAIELARKGNVLQLVSGWFAAEAPQEKSGVVHALAESQKRESIEATSRAFAHTAVVTKELHRQGTKFVLIKGPHQQKILYGDYFIRRSNDVDILVSKRDFQRTIGDLRKIGLFKVNRSPFLWWDVFVGERHLAGGSEFQWSVDLHHRLQAPGSQQPKLTSAFLDSAIVMNTGPWQVPTLAPSFVPVLSSMSLVKALARRESSIKHVCDIFAAVGQSKVSSPSDLSRLAELQGLQGTVALALRAVDAVLGVGVSPSRTVILPEVSDSELARMVTDPETVRSWPSRLELLRAACGGISANYLRELTWFTAAEIARKSEKVVRLAFKTGNRVSR